MEAVCHSRPFVLYRLRSSNRIRCEGKGFGQTDQADSSKNRKLAEDKKKVKEVIRSVKEGRARPVDPKEAAEGRLDYATVKDWSPRKGDAQPTLDDLEIKDFTMDAVSDPSTPFYYRLTKKLELLQSMGELEIEAGELRPFEEWQYESESYGTVLINLAKAHRALEETVAKIVDNLPMSTRIKNFSLETFRYVSSERGLDRGSALMNDLTNFIENTTGLDKYDIKAEHSVREYETCLYKLMRTSLNSEDSEQQISALCKVLTHAYLLRIMHFTSGSRIAAAAVDRLKLAEKNAVTAYKTYPPTITDPVITFVNDINAAGKLMDEDHRQHVFDELTTAFKMSSVFYAPLARDPAAPPFQNTLR